MCVHHFYELVIHRLRVFVARSDRVGCAMFEVIAHELARHAPQRLVYRRHLREDVGTIAILFDHLLEAAHLPFDPPQSLEIAAFDVRVDTVRHGRTFRLRH